MHESGEAAHRESATAEAKQVELVAGFEAVHEKPVERPDVILHPVTERSTREPVRRPARANAVVIEDDLVDTVGRPAADGARDLGDVRRPATPRLLVDLIAIVPGAVGANDDALHHCPPRLSELDECRESGGRYQIRAATAVPRLSLRRAKTACREPTPANSIDL